MGDLYEQDGYPVGVSNADFAGAHDEDLCVCGHGHHEHTGIGWSCGAEDCDCDAYEEEDPRA